MLKKRVAAAIVIENNIAVQTKKFQTVHPLGKPEILAAFLDRWQVDEIVLVGKRCSALGESISNDTIKAVAGACTAPLTVIGGLHNMEAVAEAFESGADKIGLNTACLRKLDFVAEVGKRYGAQSVVCAIDAQRTESGHVVYDHVNSVPVDLEVAEFSSILESAGAGEIFLNSVDNDGMGIGFDEELIAKVCNAVSIPVMACGGAATPSHFASAFHNTALSGCVAANFFNFYEHSVTLVKVELLKDGIAVRLDTHEYYDGVSIDDAGRLKKYDQAHLDKLIYEVVVEERI